MDIRKASAVAGALLIIGCIIAASVPQVNAQSGTRSGGSGTRVVQEPFEVRFWNWLQTVQYRNWSPLPGQTADNYPGEGPHGAQLKMYVNRTAAADPRQFANGSILIKENYAEDGVTLMAVTAMYKSEGFDPEHGDWYWVKYEPNGRVTRMENLPVAGRVQMCIDCHAGAEGDDYTFAND